MRQAGFSHEQHEPSRTKEFHTEDTEGRHGEHGEGFAFVALVNIGSCNIDKN